MSARCAAIEGHGVNSSRKHAEFCLTRPSTTRCAITFACAHMASGILFLISYIISYFSSFFPHIPFGLRISFVRAGRTRRSTRVYRAGSRDQRCACEPRANMETVAVGVKGEGISGSLCKHRSAHSSENRACAPCVG